MEPLDPLDPLAPEPRLFQQHPLHGPTGYGPGAGSLPNSRDHAPSYCDVCGRSYAYRSSLYRHLKYECGKAPQFQCPYCPRKTKQKLNLREHIRMLHPGRDNPV